MLTLHTAAKERRPTLAAAVLNGLACGLWLVATGCRPAPLSQADGTQPTAGPGTNQTTPAADLPAIRQSDSLIQPEDLVYRGAFRLPDVAGDSDWDWGGTAMTYYPNGDPAGPDDGYPGSLFATGHDHRQRVSEINIPAPVVSADKNLADLNVAETLQPFRDVRAGLVAAAALELPRAGLAYLPAQGAQTTGKLHFCWGQHYQEQRTVSHGWCEIDLANPQAAGGWYLGEYSNYSTNDYLFDIPAEWAAAHTPGRLLATGRFRDGGWSGQGPSLFAYGPWNEGNPPPAGTTLGCTPLLLYTRSDDWDTPASHTMTGYHHSDEWSGGAWLTAGDSAAVLFVGTKGLGECWYGFANGVVWPDEPPYPPVPDPPHNDRGWWSTRFAARMLFYDPASLAAAAHGQMPPHSPQPYAYLDVDRHLFNPPTQQRKYRLGAAAYDRANRLLYVLEIRADGDRPLAHVWSVSE
jgi:hypothetical protein